MHSCTSAPARPPIALLTPPGNKRQQNHHHQIQAIARGLYALVPRDTLLLLTWRELETLVCGSPSFDLAFWRRHTTYSGYAEGDATVQLFWKVLASLTQEEQSGFVRFAWGRSRLPPKHAWFKDMQVRGALVPSLPVFGFFFPVCLNLLDRDDDRWPD